MKPELSVVICTFDRGKSLKECLEALTQQSFSNFEVIIVDGGSTDNTHKVISDYSKKLKIKKIVYRSKELAKVRDRGWKEAEGELAAWIDDDVIASKDWAKSIVEILDKHPDIGGVSGPTIVPEKLLRNRDIFSFYKPAFRHSEPRRAGRRILMGFLRKTQDKLFAALRMTIIRCIGKFWNYFFLEGKKFEVGKIFKSGAWSPGSNFPSSLRIKGLKNVDYLEACNMTLRKNLITKVGGFDYGYAGIAEWSELDLAMRVKELGYRLVFSSKVKVNHNISQSGVYSRRTNAKQRMENFFKFYFRHIFKFRIDYVFKFLSYLSFLNYYWIYKTVTTKNFDWLGGWMGTITGLKYVYVKK